MGGRRETEAGRMSQKGQSSMEYLLVMAFVFTMLVAIIVLAYSQSATFSTDVSASQIQKVGNQLVDAANTVYYAGPPTKKTIRLYFPQGVRNVTLSGNTIIFIMQGTNGPYEYAIPAATNLTGTLQPFPGIHTVTVEAQEAAVAIDG